MSAYTRILELERYLYATHKDDPHSRLLVVQLCAIAKAAVRAAEDRWPRHDKRRDRQNLPDLFA